MAPGDPFPTSSVAGASARNPEGEEIGTLSDLVIEDSTGRVCFAVIGRHRDARLLAVPWEAVILRPGERSVLLNVATKKINAAPSLDRSEWDRVTDSDWQREICDYYGCRPHRDEAWDEKARVGEAPHRRRIGPQVVLSVCMLALTTGLGYLTLRQGWFTTAAQVYEVAAAVRETTDAFRSSSADAATTAKVKAALALSKNVSAIDVNVDTYDGVTTLLGKVPSPENRDLAGQIAIDTSGVREVRNLLTVDPAIRPDQARQYLAQRVEELERQNAIAEALRETPEMEGARVKVRVAGGLVALEGTVVSDAQKARAEDVARSFTGVRGVDNKLR